MIISASFGILGIIVATVLYVLRPGLAESFKNAVGPLYTVVLNKYYVDEIYQAAIVKPLEGISRNPGAAGRIQTPMILGLALIESLVLLSFVIAFFLQGFASAAPIK